MGLARCGDSPHWGYLLFVWPCNLQSTETAAKTRVKTPTVCTACLIKSRAKCGFQIVSLRSDIDENSSFPDTANTPALSYVTKLFCSSPDEFCYLRYCFWTPLAWQIMSGSLPFFLTLSFNWCVDNSQKERELSEFGRSLLSLLIISLLSVTDRFVN